MNKNKNHDLARLLAPEDIRVGMYVTQMSVMHEHWPWDCEPKFGESPQPLRIRWLARRGGMPLRVRAVCLPFVLVESPSGKPRPLDVRRVELAEISRDYARVVQTRLRKERERRRTSADADNAGATTTQSRDDQEARE